VVSNRLFSLQDRARNASERYSSTTTLTVNVKDDDDQDPSFIYQGCMLLDGACINPEFHSSVRTCMSNALNDDLQLKFAPQVITLCHRDGLSRRSFGRHTANNVLCMDAILTLPGQS